MNSNNVFKKFTNMSEFGIILITIGFIVIVQIINPVFLSTGNMMNVLRSTGFTLMTALGMTLVLVSGGLDLSVGSVLALGGVVSGLSLLAGLPIPIAIVLGVIAGAGIGWMNGIIVVKFNIPPLIMTLGSMYMARGIVYIITEGKPVYPLPNEFQTIEQVDVGIVPKIVIVCAIMSIVFAFILKKTVFGREVYAIGGNTEAAKISGINIGKTKLLIYVIIGALAAFTGVMQASRLGSAQPGAGTGFEMTVIAAVIIGGTSTFGGVGTVLGTVIGSLFMNILTNSMQLMKVSVYWQNLVIGAILVVAVIIDQASRERKAKKAAITK